MEPHEAAKSRWKPHHWIISAVGALVPRRWRSEWKQEWRSELHHRESLLTEWNRESRHGRWDLIVRSAGAFWDALAMQPRRLEDEVFQDLRFALRLLLQSKGWTAVAVLSLALGIGANTALFSVANEVLLKSLPVRNPEQLVLFQWTSGPHLMGLNFWPGMYIDPAGGAATGRSFPYLAFERLREQSGALTDVFAFTSKFQDVAVYGQEEPPVGQLVSGNYFSGLGVSAERGRVLTAEDDREASEPSVVISHRYWERKFGRDPAAVGKTMRIGATLYTVVGVTPASFSGTQQVGDAPDVTFPLAMAERLGNIGPKFAPQLKRAPWMWGLMLMGRLKPGASYDQARNELDKVFLSAAAEGWNASPAAKRNGPPRDAPHLRVVAGGQGLMDVRQSLARTIEILMVIVALVLLIVCANLANLLLARAASRHRELAVRTALGARRGRLVRQLLTESLALSAGGAVLGVLFAYWAKDAFLIWIRRVTPSFAVQPQLDFRVLAFAAAITLVTGVLVGLVPALRATRLDLNSTMKEGGRGSGVSRSLASRSLLTVQVALSLVLLVGAGLFVRTLVNLQRADVGFDTRNLLLFQVFPQWSRHPRSHLQELYAELLERLRAVQGVKGATASGYPLLTGDRAMPYLYVPNYERKPGEDPTVYYYEIWHNFFEVTGMPLLAGRELKLQDAENWANRGPYVAVVNETLARRYFPGMNPVGQRVGITKDPTVSSVAASDLVEIVGVVRDAKYATVRADIPPSIFTPYEPGPLTFEVRTAGDPMSMVETVREVVRQTDPDLRLTNFRSQSEEVELTFARERHFAFLSSLFGSLALLLACIGLYGLLSYSVASRTREIGIRMALGAQQGAVMRLVMRESLWLVAVGVVLGLGGALAATRLIAGMLYGLGANDALNIAAAILLMMIVAAVAAYLPARRASRVDPVTALRYE